MSLDANRSLRIKGVNRAHPLSRGLILVSPMNQTGNLVVDLLGRHHRALSAGLFEVKYGRSAWQSGYNFLAYGAPKQIYDIRTNAHTFSFWFLKDGYLTVTDRYIYDNGYADTQGRHSLWYNNKTLKATIAYDGGTDLTLTWTDAITSLNVWYHICMTWDGGASANGLHLYVDGKEVRSATTDGVGSPQVDAQSEYLNSGLRLGDRTYGGGRSITYQGPAWYSNLNVWNRALSEPEVQLLRTRADLIYDFGPNVYAQVAAAAPSFNPAWAVNCNRLVA